MKSLSTRNFVLFCLVCIMTLNAYTSAQAEEPIPYNQPKLLEAFFSIVMIRGFNQDGGMSYGSGIVIGQDKILTNCHIFRLTKQPWISRGEDVFPIESFQADRYHDICLVYAKNLPFTPVKPADTEALHKGQPIVTIGYSNGMNAPLTALGNVQAMYPFDSGKVVRTNARFVMGASGSGLFDAEGRLLGINTIKTPGNNAYYYSLPLAWVKLAEAQPMENVFPIIGKTFWEEEDAKKPFFMQMAQPELQEDWPKLQNVAESWIKSEPTNSEAWYELGLAHEQQQQLKEAITAYEHATQVDARNLDALFRLGMIAAQQHQQDKYHQLYEQISLIDKPRAEQLRNVVECTTQC